MRHYLLLLAACGSDPQPLREVVTDSIILQTNELAEATMTGGPGDVAIIEVDAPAAKLDWNIHGHGSGETVTIEEQLGVMQIRYTFEPPEQADWNLLLRNKDAGEMTLQIRVELFGDITWTAD